MYHDMRMASTWRLASHPTASAEVSRLLARYPRLGEAELARLINLYRELPLVESALLMTDRALARRLDAFVTDHQSVLRTPWKEYAALLLLTGTAAALLITLVASS